MSSSSSCALVRLPAKIPGRIVLADPELAGESEAFDVGAVGGAAADASGVAPDDLGVVTADVGAAVVGVIVELVFAGPRLHDRFRRRGSGRDVDVLAVRGIAVLEDAAVGPGLSAAGDVLVPDNVGNRRRRGGRRVLSHGVVGVHDRVGSGAVGGFRAAGALTAVTAGERDECQECDAECESNHGAFRVMLRQRMPMRSTSLPWRP